MSDHVPVSLVLAIARPGGVWSVERITLWFAPPPPTDHATLEQEAIAAYSAANLRSDALHVWLMEDDGWEEDAGIAEDRRRKRAVAEDEMPL